MGPDRELRSCVEWPALARIRRSRKVSLKQIAAITKIKTQYLKAIEEGKFHELPGGVYTTSYIRQYSRVIDFDEDDLVARFNLRTVAASPTQTSVVRQESRVAHHDLARLWDWVSRKEKRPG